MPKWREWLEDGTKIPHLKSKEMREYAELLELTGNSFPDWYATFIDGKGDWHWPICGSKMYTISVCRIGVGKCDPERMSAEFVDRIKTEIPGLTDQALQEQMAHVRSMQFG